MWIAIASRFKWKIVLKMFAPLKEMSVDLERETTFD